MLVLGCTPEALGQDDGFRARIPTACKTLESCRQLQEEARRRSVDCQPNTIGYVRCDDARLDSDEIQHRIARLQETRADEQAKADAVTAERREQAEEKGEAERQRLTWLDDAVGSCARTHTDEPCRSASSARYDESTRDVCLERCKLVIEQDLQSEYARALDDCTSLALASKAPQDFDCHLEVVDVLLEASLASGPGPRSSEPCDRGRRRCRAWPRCRACSPQHRPTPPAAPGKSRRAAAEPGQEGLRAGDRTLRRRRRQVSLCAAKTFRSRSIVTSRPDTSRQQRPLSNTAVG